MRTVDDVDQHMHSSSDAEKSDDGFVVGNDPMTPAPSQSMRPLTDISPPQTQQDLAQARREKENSVNHDLKECHKNGKGAKRSDEDELKSPQKKTEYKPGDTWMNKKAQEEYAKAMENVLDKGWHMS